MTYRKTKSKKTSARVHAVGRNGDRWQVGKATAQKGLRAWVGVWVLSAWTSQPLNGFE